MTKSNASKSEPARSEELSASRCSAAEPKIKLKYDIDWEKVRTTDDPRVVLEAMLDIWDPEDDAYLSGWGPGEIDLILAARRILGR